MKPDAVTEVAKLYTQALCGCEHCQSVLSPSAYFVDTLFWLDARESLQPLLDVRPDLAELQLTCATSETPMPYSDLLIELLEQIVGAPASIGAAPNATTGAADALLTYPEHTDRPEADAAYKVLRWALSSRLLPYHLALDEVRTYLDRAGVGRVEVVDAFVGLHGTEITALRRAVLGAGGSPQIAKHLSEGGGPAWWGLTSTSEYATHLVPLYAPAVVPPATEAAATGLLVRAQVDDFDLVMDLMRTRYLNADARLGVVLPLAAPADADACDPANLLLQVDTAPPEADPVYVNPGTWVFDRMAAFLRLMDLTDWPALAVDKALYALGVSSANHLVPPSPAYGLDTDVVRGVAAMVEIVRLTGLSVEEVSSWWSTVDTYLDRQSRSDPVRPFYEQRFLDPTVVGEEGAAFFALNAARTELASGTSTTESVVARQTVAVASALRVDVGQLQAAEAFLERMSVPIGTNMATLWQLLRWTSLARASGLSIEDAEAWRHIFGSNPFADTLPLDPSVALRWLEALAELGGHGLDVSRVAWIFGHVGPGVVRLAPTDATNEETLRGLQSALVALEQELSRTVADEPTIRAALTEAALAAADIETIVEIVVAGSLVVSGDLDPLVGWVPDVGVLATTLTATTGSDARMAVLVGALQAATLTRRRRELAVGAVEAAFPTLRREHIDVLSAAPIDAIDGYANQNALAALYLPSGTGFSLVDSDLTASGAAPAHRALHYVAKIAALVDALRLDAASLAEWLADAARLGVPALTDVPVVAPAAGAEFVALDGLWSTLRPALDWFDLDRAFTAPTPVASTIRATLRSGQVKAALAMIAARAQWDVALANDLLFENFVAYRDLTDPGGTPPGTVNVTLGGTPYSVPGTGTWSQILVALAAAINAAASSPFAAVALNAVDGAATSAAWSDDAVKLRVRAKRIADASFAVTGPLTAGPLVSALTEALERVVLTPVGGMTAPVPTSVALTVAGTVFEVTAGVSWAARLAALRDAVNVAPPAGLVAEALDATGAVTSGSAEALQIRAVVASSAAFDVASTALVAEAALHDASLFSRFLERWRILSTLGVDLASAARFATADPGRDVAAEARRVLRSQYPTDAAWGAVGRDVRDPIRRRQQRALYAQVRAVPGGPQTDGEFYSTYFVDPQMDPCMLTTRMVLANSAVQTYVNRAFLGLKTDGVLVPLDSDDEAEWRRWRSSYRMWEAARKLLLFPENWLSPSLRVEKSAEFEALEGKLSQEGLAPQAAELAMKAFLVDILPYGNPLVAAITQDANLNLHLVARTGPQQNQLVYRVGQFLEVGKWRWSAWTKVPFPVPAAKDTRIALYSLNGELILVWTTASVLVGEDAEGVTTCSSTITVHFSVLAAQEWAAPQDCYVRDVPTYAVDQFHLLLYEHAASDEQVLSGLYCTLEYSFTNTPNGSGSSTVWGYDGFVLKWSPTRRSFVPDDGAAQRLKVLDEDGDLVFTGGQREETLYYKSQAFTVDGTGAYLLVYEAETLVGTPRTSRLGLADDTPRDVELFAFATAGVYQQRGIPLFPANFADWASNAPFVVGFDARHYLVL